MWYNATKDCRGLCKRARRALPILTKGDCPSMEKSKIDRINALAKKAKSIGLTERELRQTMERLCALGLVSAAGRAAPVPADKPATAEPKLVPAAELPQYTAEDIASRMLSDAPMQTVRREAEQLYGRKLTTPEMNMLLGLRDYLGLPADVLMELIHYVFQEYRAERGHAGTPTMRRIEKEAYAWADQEIHTTAQAEEYLQRKQARQGLAQQVRP